MTEELTNYHSIRRWITTLVNERFSGRYNCEIDVYTSVDSKWVATTDIKVTLVKAALVRGGKSRPPITYKVTMDNVRDPEAAANKVVTALMLMLMEEGEAA